MGGTLTSETAKALVRQTTDPFLQILTRPLVATGGFPKEVVFGVGGLADLATPPRGVQSRVNRALGYSRLRGAVVSSVAGTLRIFQAWTVGTIVMTAWIVTQTLATVPDPISGLEIQTWDVPIEAEFVAVRFTGNLDLAGTFEFGSFLLPVS